MRVSHVGVLASVVLFIACARGADINGDKVVYVDAGLAVGGDMGVVDTGGTSDESGGSVGEGGAVGTGDAPSSGGMVTGTGGTTGSGGKTGAGGTTTMGSGGKASGGTTAGSGGSGSGGKGSGGAATGGTTSGAGGAGTCPAGQKSCNGMCALPAPGVGCGLTGCDPCMVNTPSNGYTTCVKNQCAWDCLSGYTKMGDTCVGNSGNGGSGSCNASKCPQTCTVVLGPACCKSDGTCGCPLFWIPGTCG